MEPDRLGRRTNRPIRPRGCSDVIGRLRERAHRAKSQRLPVILAPSFRSLLVCCVMATVAGACDQTFEPLAPSQAQWSVFGYLDASADTQWIRVMPIRPVKLTSPDASGATVTLEDLGTNQIIPLRDSLFTFTHYADSTLGSAGAYVHDFWTTHEMEPGASYRLSVTHAGDEPAEAVVKIPQDYEVEVWIAQPPPHYSQAYGSDYLRVLGLRHLPFVAQTIHFHDGCGAGVDTVRYKGTAGDDGVYTIPVDKVAVPPRGGGYCGSPVPENRDFWLVGSDSTWPSGSQYSPQGVGATELTSNVTHAVGFLGGVLTKVTPYENCTFAAGGTAVPNYCQLRYDKESATLSGTVTETRCGDGPIPSVTVQLTRIDPVAPEIRTYLTGPDGAFEIAALEPGTPYALKARAKPLPVFGGGELDIYTLRYDTLTFAPGEHRRYDVALQRLIPCDQKP